MFNFFKTLTSLAVLAGFVVTANPSLAGETDALTNLLKQVDKHVCQSPKKIMDFYAKDMVIIADDKRVLPEHRIKDYEAMIAELEEMKCVNTRTVLSGTAGKDVGYLLVDELISVSSAPALTNDNTVSVPTCSTKTEVIGKSNRNIVPACLITVLCRVTTHCIIFTTPSIDGAGRGSLPRPC